VRRWGAKILSSATTVDEALWLEAHGVHAVIAQGLEAGGHRGHFLSGDLTAQVGTFELVQQVVRAVKVPVIAAGGIADARGVAAAIALGAAGAQIGTAYLLCPEATTSAVHRAALKSDAARNTALTNVFTGRPARGIVNRAMRELGPLCPVAPEFPLAANAITPLRAKAESLGSGDFSPLWAGENTLGCKEVPAAQLTRELGCQPGSAGKPAQAIYRVLEPSLNIVLIGMPGSGKSTVGRMLAEKLRCGFIDTDQLIESSRHRSLQDIVDSDGYETLRRIEQDILLDIDTRDHVIATGGSAVYSDKAMAHLRALGRVVFLYANLASLEQRIHNLGLRGLARRPGQTLGELFAEREALYRNSADVTIDGSSLTPQEVCARVLEVLGR
jgi:shikimate kinase